MVLTVVKPNAKLCRTTSLVNTEIITKVTALVVAVSIILLTTYTLSPYLVSVATDNT